MYCGLISFGYVCASASAEACLGPGALLTLCCVAGMTFFAAAKPHRSSAALRNANQRVPDASPMPQQQEFDDPPRDQAAEARLALQGMQRMLGVLGHELRTPLAGIQVLSEYLLTEPELALEAKHRQFLQLMHDEVVRLLTLVNNMLEAAQLYHGVARWKWSAVKIDCLAERAVELIRPQLDESRVRLTYCVPERLRMRGDDDALLRLMLNLLSNAQKNTRDGEIELTVAELFDDSKRWIEIRVRDTGSGIAQTLVHGLGVPFALTSGTVGHTVVKGSGLGLSICKGIAAAHGGSISIQSTQGQGTIATARLRADLRKPEAYSDGGTLLHEVAA